MVTGRRRLRIGLLFFLCCAAAATAGCHTRFRYNTDVRDAFVYECTVYRGGTDGEGTPIFDETPAGAFDIIIKPYLQRSGNIWLKLTTPTPTGRNTVFGQKNLGEKLVYMSALGKVLESKRQNNTFSMYDLFFELPAKRQQPGDSWTSQQYHEVHRTIMLGRSEGGQQGQYFALDYEKSLPIKYTYENKVRCAGNKCARLRVSAEYQETIAPDNNPLYAALSYSRNGEVDFNLKLGMVQTATYKEVFFKQILDSYSDEVIMEANDVSKTVFTLKNK